MLERIAAVLEIEPHELFYMPSIAKKALIELKITIATDMGVIGLNTSKKKQMPTGRHLPHKLLYRI